MSRQLANLIPYHFPPRQSCIAQAAPAQILIIPARNYALPTQKSLLFCCYNTRLMLIMIMQCTGRIDHDHDVTGLTIRLFAQPSGQCRALIVTALLVSYNEPDGDMKRTVGGDNATTNLKHSSRVRTDHVRGYTWQNAGVHHSQDIIQVGKTCGR